MNKLKQIQENFIKQLDDVNDHLFNISNRKFFDYLKAIYPLKYSSTGRILTKASYNYDIYLKINLNSCFILGFTYFEGFIYEFAKEFLFLNPSILTKNRLIKELISENKIKVQKERSELLYELIDLELNNKNIFYTFEDKINFYKDKFNIKLKEYRIKLKISNLIRNCLIHKNGSCDKKLQDISENEFKCGEQIILTIDKMNEYGKISREISEFVFKEAQKNLKVDTLI